MSKYISLLLVCLTIALAQSGDVEVTDIYKDTDCMHVYTTVCVWDSNGWYMPELLMPNFNFTEDGVPVIPPRIEQLNICEESCADIVFLFDLSGSMDDNVAAFSTALSVFAAGMAGLDYRISMAVFNGCPEDIGGVRTLVHTDYTSPVPCSIGTDIWAANETEFNKLFDAVEMWFALPWSARGSGWEDQWGVTWWAIDTLDWRPGCRKTVVMFTDEEVQVGTAPCVPYLDESDSALFEMMDYCFAESVIFFAVCPEDSSFEWYPASGDDPSRQYYTGYRDLAETTGGIWNDLFATDYSEMVGTLAEAIADIHCCYEFRYTTDSYCVVDLVNLSVDVTVGTDYVGTDDTTYKSFCPPEIVPIMPSPCGGITSCTDQTIIGFYENSEYGSIEMSSYILVVDGDTIDHADIAVYGADSFVYSPSATFGHMDTVIFSFDYYRDLWGCFGSMPPCTFYIDSRPPVLVDNYPAEGDTVLVGDFVVYGSIWDDYSGIDPASSPGWLTILLDGDTAEFSSPTWTPGDSTGFRVDSLYTFWDGNVTVCLGGLYDSPDYDYCPSNVMRDTCWTFYLATVERHVAFPIAYGAPCDTVIVPLFVDDMEHTSIENAVLRFNVDTEVFQPFRIITTGTITHGWAVDSMTVDPITGEVYTEISGPTISGGSGGVLFNVEGTVPCNATGGSYSAIEIEFFEFNEGYPMVTWADGFFIVTLDPQVFFCDVRLNRTVLPSSEDNTITFGATFGGTDLYNMGLDYIYVPPPDWMVDGWFQLTDPSYPHIFGLRRDVRAPEPIVRWHIVTSDEPNGIATWNPIALPEGEFRLDSLIDMKRENTAYFTENETLLIEWLLPELSPDTIVLATGWNMVSLPVLPAGVPATEVFPTDYGVFRYNTPGSGYQFATDICDGEGYWVFADIDTTYLTAGSAFFGYRRQIYRGWNLIGATSSAISVADIGTDPPGVIVTPIWGWDGSDYVAASSLLPGNGYWLLSTTNAVLRTPSTYRSRVSVSPKPLWEATIVVTNGAGKTLLSVGYAGSAAPGLGIGDEPLPPMAPGFGERSAFLLIENFPAGRDLSPSGEWTLYLAEDSDIEIEAPDNVVLCIDGMAIAGGETRFLSRGNHEISGLIELPEVFEIIACVPNPFNARTDVIVALPECGELSLNFYDITGRNVDEIVGEYPAGIARIPWDGTDRSGRELASGLYLVRVVYGKHVATTRAMLIK